MASCVIGVVLPLLSTFVKLVSRYNRSCRPYGLRVSGLVFSACCTMSGVSSGAFWPLVPLAPSPPSRGPNISPTPRA
jgi:hypothetical protein